MIKETKYTFDDCRLGRLEIKVMDTPGKERPFEISVNDNFVKGRDIHQWKDFMKWIDKCIKEIKDGGA